MTDRSLWFDTHLLAERAGRQARAACERLGEATHERILGHGDRLAEVSATVAQHFYLRAASVFERFGEDDFSLWVDKGHELLTTEPAQREAALAYFSVAPRAIANAGIGRVIAWRDAGCEVSATSRKLGAAFFEGTVATVDKVESATLRAWAREGLSLNGVEGWRGEFLGRAFFAAAPSALPVLEPGDFRAWASLAVALHPVAKETEVFAALPPGFHLLKGNDRSRFFALVLAAAEVDQKAAWAIYRRLPGTLRHLHISWRGEVLEILENAASIATVELRDITPVVAALVNDIPKNHRQAALDMAVSAANRFPGGAIALLRSLPAAYEEAPHEGVEEWIRRGIDIALANGDAGVAYFARESRTSLRVLHASSTAAELTDVQGFLRKYIQMLSGKPASIRSAMSSQLRPEIEEFPLEEEVALPLKLGRFTTHEDNCRLYRFLAAQLSGRRLHGTYQARRPADENKSLYEYIIDPEKPALLEDIFLIAEGYRIAKALAREFPGIAVEQRSLSLALLDLVDPETAPPPSAVFDFVLLWLLSERPIDQLPSWMPSIASVIGPCMVPLAIASATVDESLTVAEQLTTELAARGEMRGEATPAELAFERMTGEALYDIYGDEDGGMEGQGTGAAKDDENAPPEIDRQALDEQLELDGDESEGAPAGAPMSPEELQRLIEAGAKINLKQGRSNEGVEGLGLYISDLIGKVPQEQIDELRKVLGETKRPDKGAPRRWLERRAEGATFYYDEWDYHIQDYRQRWCRLLEMPVDGDAGEFFNQTLLDYASMIPDVRRQFQRIRPEMYRKIRGLEDGEDFDLNAVIAARVDRRAKRSPSHKLYVARTREERDVATLFLIDMSASTDEPFEEAGTEPTGGENTLDAFRDTVIRPQKKSRRIIDVTKEALVIMAEALEEIGDAYAIYGFSGHGRKNVEFYMVKGFNEALSGAVKGRIGALEPKRSTRMGAALRHAAEKMAAISARSRHIILLSDGFPQDFDYGQDRRSNVYGLRDTTVALREVEAAGIVPFCITVDKAGHDYLREMCDESRYMVIDDISSLPSELPKVYQRVVTT